MVANKSMKKPIAEKSRPKLSVELIAVFLIVLIVTTFAQKLYFSNVVIEKIQDDAQRNISEIVKLNKEYADSRIFQIFDQFVSLKLTIESILNIMNYRDMDSLWQTDCLSTLKRQMEMIYISNNSELIATTAYLRDWDYMLNCGLPLDAYYERKLSSIIASSWEGDSYLWINPNDGTEADGEQSPLAIITPLCRMSGQCCGFLMFRIRAEFLVKILREFSIFDNGYIAIITDNNGMIAAGEQRLPLTEKSRQHLMDSSDDAGMFSPPNEHFAITVLYETLACNHWKLAAVYSRNEALSSATAYRRLLVFTLLLSFVGMGAIYIVVRIRVTKPALALADKVRNVTYNKPPLPHILRRMSNELSLVDTALDAMVLRINGLIHDIKEEQQKKASFEIHLLQEQIQPHFLYNTLFSIDQLVQMNENADAHKMLCALSNFYRIGLSNGDMLLTMREELSLTEQFLCIQQMRFGPRFTYRIETEGDLDSVQIPKMTLQPIVENAIFHGVVSDPRPKREGMLQIRCKQMLGALHIEVHDNGCGMDEKRLAQVRAAIREGSLNSDVSDCFALRNVSSRLKLYCEHSSMQIVSRLNEGTIITIDIPFQKEGYHV